VTGGVAALPCLNSNISIDLSKKPRSKAQKAWDLSREVHSKNLALEAQEVAKKADKTCELSTQNRKTAFILENSIKALCEKYGVGRIGFLTLTFRDNVQTHKEAQRRLNSLLTNFVSKKDSETKLPRYPDYIGCVERQKSGRIHFHLLIVMAEDIKTGFDHDQVKARNYSSASQYLKNEWGIWRRSAKLYGFGRCELKPVKTNAAGVSKYIAKYIAKHIENRLPEDKGARLVRYSRGARIGTTNFMFNSPGSKLWRENVALVAEKVHQDNTRRRPHFIEANDPTRLKVPDIQERPRNLDDMTRMLGPRWAFRNREEIINIRIPHAQVPDTTTHCWAISGERELTLCPRPLAEDAPGIDLSLNASCHL